MDNENMQTQEQIVSDVEEVATDSGAEEVCDNTENVENVDVADETAEIVESVEESDPADEHEDAEPAEEIAMLTVRDLRIKIQDAYRVHQNKWGWIAFWFPANNEAWIEDEERDSELEYVRVAYTVAEDEVTITDVQPVTLSVSVSELNDVMSARDEAIMKANEKINELSAQIASLRPYKDAADKAEQERVEAETAEKRKQFKEKMLASKLFTEKEIETSEALKAMIEQLDEPSLKSEIAERFMAKLDSEPVATEVAEINKAHQERVQVDEGNVDNKTFMRIFLGKN